MANLHFELVTPEKLLRSESVYMVVVPGTEGDFGVLVGHAPVMSTIRPGAIAIYTADGVVPERIFIDGGFAEVNDKGLTILAEGATPVEDITPDAVASELAEARENFRIATSDVERAMAEKRIDRLVAMQDVLTAA